ncbi:serine/threonine protein kinase [Novipirellula artificiosorum]|uniref:Serine/threonine-protein kinase PknB n=1 Tax=Novipirellula artificiosorum TaxID=2528016 RepID=A0A5C6CYV7_9BACT|nr:serine/threonine-protein kinase [Novipirellula artificiosorum]TWU28784.1 Serine/threonine-protein kinase PknB [Novipirellula artificiosorum]
MGDSANRTKEIFLAAMSIEQVEDREKYVDDQCGDDLQLRNRVERLIAAADAPDSLLDRTESVVSQAPLDECGKIVGSYKILDRIGEGGMGSVYLAEQKQPVKRRVAIKLIKPGMDSRQIVARFDAERQALAMMDHPNIAKVLEAGTADDGRPYFVMELVKGVSIIEFCQQHKLSPHDRLKLFIEVCSAVQHAHQKGIIHRDLKPSNILVAMFDDVPTVKVIDFGVAKAINQDLTERTMFTQIGQIIGTIEYMSPEQAQFNQLDIDTRSDIYSLGVLLYELLTGMTPFDKDRLRSAALDNVLKIIREEEPPKPSTRVSTAQKAGMVAGGQGDPGKGRLFSMLRGDLDWLIMKALAKERDRRYQTASAVAADVQRYLDGEAIEARPPSTRYRLSKFVRRNRSSVVAGLLVSLILVGATVALTLSLTEALRLQGKLKDALIYRAVIDAMAGNIETACDSIDEIGDRSSEKWKTTLRALNNVHNGNAEAAVEPMEKLCESEPDNVVAGSILAAAYDRSYQSKDKEEKIMQLNTLERTNPLEELLYQSVQSVFFEPQSATEQIQTLVDEHNWELARVLLAKAKVYLAIDTSDWEEAARAAELIQDSKKRLPPLQTTYSVELMANLTAYYLAKPEITESRTWLEDADAAAAILEEQYPLASVPELAAYYLVRRDAPERSMEIVREFATSTQLDACFLGLQLLTGDYSDRGEGVPFSSYITIETVKDLDRAAESIRNEIKDYEGVSVRTVWGRTPLCACGEQEKADTIRVWQQMLEDSESLLWNLEYALNLLSGNWALEDGLEKAGDSRIKQSLVHFAVGTRALYIEKDREKAKRQYEACEKFKLFDVDYYYLTRAYLKRFEDPDWPHWIPREESE